MKLHRLLPGFVIATLLALTAFAGQRSPAGKALDASSCPNGSCCPNGVCCFMAPTR